MEGLTFQNGGRGGGRRVHLREGGSELADVERGHGRRPRHYRRHEYAASPRATGSAFDARYRTSMTQGSGGLRRSGRNGDIL